MATGAREEGYKRELLATKATGARDDGYLGSRGRPHAESCSLPLRSRSSTSQQESEEGFHKLNGVVRSGHHQPNHTNQINMTRMTKKTQPAEAPLTEIEKIRARTMMRNNRIFQSLGIPAIVSMIRRSNDGKNGSAITTDESAITNSESSDYNPNDDEGIDGDEVDDTVVEKNVKKSRRKKSAVKKVSKSGKNLLTSATMALGRVFAIPPGGSKRMLETEETPPPPRMTRQKANEIAVPNREESQPLQDVESSVHKGMDERSSLRVNLTPVSRTLDKNQPLDSADFSREHEEPINNEGTVAAVRNFRTGSGLEKLTKGLGAKVRIEIAEGMKRPEKHMQAAKLASEGGFIVRTHMPILPHFKEFKKDKSLVADFIGKVAGNFDMDTDSIDIQNACNDILKNVNKNRRHYVKKHFFDKVEASKVSIKSPVPYITDAEWQRLTQLWSSPKHKDTCEKNKINRTKVKLGQKTGSRCYVAHVHAIKEERKVDALSAVEMFTVTHNSTKHGFSEKAKQAIAEMENKMAAPVPEGEAPKSYVEVVAEVLSKKSSFLKNVGLQSSCTTKSSKLNADVSAHVLDLEEKLERSQHQTEALLEEMAAMKKKAKESDAAQALLLKRAEENDARYAQLMALLAGKPIEN